MWATPCASVSAKRTAISVEKRKPSMGLPRGDAQRVEHGARAIGEARRRLAPEQDVGGERAAVLRELDPASRPVEALDRGRPADRQRRRREGPRAAGSDADLQSAERLRPLDDDDRDRRRREGVRGELGLARLVSRGGSAPTK